LTTSLLRGVGVVDFLAAQAAALVDLELEQH
jgi:hypothetical protein